MMNNPHAITEESLRRQILLALVLVVMGLGGLMCLMNMYLA